MNELEVKDALVSFRDIAKGLEDIRDVLLAILTNLEEVDDDE